MCVVVGVAVVEDRGGLSGDGRTLGGPSNDVDSLGVLLESCEVLDFAVVSVDLDLPQLDQVRRRNICEGGRAHACAFGMARGRGGVLEHWCLQRRLPDDPCPKARNGPSRWAGSGHAS